MEIIQETPPQADHAKQTTARAVVLHIFLQMIGEVVDMIRQQGDLNIGRAGVALMQLKFLGNLHFRFFFHSGYFFVRTP